MVTKAVYWPVCIFCKGEPVKSGEQIWTVISQLLI